MPSRRDTKNARNDQEIELKLALPTDDPAELLRCLSRAAPLNRRKPARHHLHSVYFDTPQQQLLRAHSALRIRRVDTAGGTPRWLQTLKTGPKHSTALSRRGEWETPVDGPALEPAALDAEAWSRVDPGGSLVGKLGPCFATDFERTIWMVKRRDGAAVEVALDIGAVTSGERKVPICELELELKSGPVSALFDMAETIAASVAVLPLATSKAQRGYALAAGAMVAPTKADPPRLLTDMRLHDAAQLVLRETFGHFSANLHAVCHSDDPEVVHQARVAWRRMRSALRLFKPVLPTDGRPDWTALEPLLVRLRELRDLDVAYTDTMPPLRDAFVADSADRANAWDVMMRELARVGAVQRIAVRHALQDPGLGLCLLQATRWLEPAATMQDTGTADDPLLERWAIRRATRLHKRLKLARKNAGNPQALHQLRLLAKRTRYSLESLRGVLPERMLRKWYPVAVDLQKTIGAGRDLLQAITLLEQTGARGDLTVFLRGVVAGRTVR